MRVLLTGSTGFLGCHALQALLSQGHRVLVAHRTGSDLEHLAGDVATVNIDEVTLEAAIGEHGIQAIVHLACEQGRRGAGIPELINANLVLGIRLLEAARAGGVAFFLNADTMLPGHLNAYALSKKQLTQWLPHYADSLAIANLRLGNMFGAGEPETGFLAWLLGEFHRGAERVQLTAGEQQRDFVHAADVADALVAVLEACVPTGLSEFDVGSGELWTLRTFVETVQQEYQRVTGHVPSRLEFGALPYRDGELMKPDFDTSRLFDLGWRPGMSTRARLRQTIGERLRGT